MTHSLYQLALARRDELIREAADRRRTTRRFPRFRLASRG